MFEKRLNKCQILMSIFEEERNADYNKVVLTQSIEAGAPDFPFAT